MVNNESIEIDPSHGKVIKEFDMPGEDGWFALNLNPNHYQSFWSNYICTMCICKFDTDS